MDSDPASTSPYLERLNPPQRAAVERLDGPLLVLAGAGTGKTRVLTTRLAHILSTRRAFPSQVLAVTFTNKAAREMKGRIGAMIGAVAEGVWLGTFHSLSARILRRHAELVGLRPDFTILDTDDQARLMKQLLQAERIDDKKWPARAVLYAIERWKDRGLAPDRVAADAGGELAAGRAQSLYAQYQERLRVLNACDFGDLLLHCLTLFTTRADVLDEYHRRFRYILVDEYQDTNVAQYMWLRLLAQGSRNLCCVGDDDQSVYGWRGAEVGNILRFEKDFEDATVVRLEQNYRSTGHILACASALIAHNRERLGKTLWTAADPGEKVQLRGVWDGEEEARWAGEEIEALQRAGQPLGQVALLVRAGFQTREFEERFIELGLPYRVVGGPRFYERAEIRDALAYARLVAQDADDLAFERIVNLPRRGVGEKALQSLHRVARARGIPLARAAAELVETDEVKGPARAGLRRFLEDVARWRAALATHHHAEVMEMALDESGYTAMWRQDRSPEAPGRLENLKEFVSALEGFDTLAGFLEHVSLVMENAEGAPGEMVSLMTLHSAKGLEFDVVFLPGWEEGLFPHPRALDEKGAQALEEERRLAHVGLTRARRRAYVSFAANRRVHGLWQSSIPSRFVEELPAEHVERVAQPGLWGGAPARRQRFDEFDQSQEWVAAPAPPRRPVRVIEGRAELVPPRPASTAGFAPGDRVFHEKFGYGIVRAADAGKLDVEFPTGRKKVMDSFLRRG
ncbi:MAG: DNA helicase II [Alphaproteobacteria bacterium]|nr:DNA helicase II [Alphaproteobacteria bacterium]